MCSPLGSPVGGSIFRKTRKTSVKMHHRRQRVEQRPRPAQHRALVLAAQLAQREVAEELAGFGELRTVAITG